MKKLLTIATSVLLLVSCSENDVKQTVLEQDYAIDFSATSDNTTKAAINSNEDLAKEGGFVVYGYKKAADAADWSAAQTIFDAVNVTSSGNNGAYVEGSTTNWTYSPKKYWDKNGIYCFYAVAPANPTAGSYSVTGNADAKKIVVTNAASAISTSSDDYLISRAGVLNRPGSNQTDNVDFTFNHIMAKLGFKVQRQAGVTATITVTEMKMTGWNSNAGTFTQSANATPNTIECSEWEQSDGTAGSATLVGEGKTQTSVVLSTDNASELTDKYIMVPQAITYSKSDAGVETGLTFSLKYTLSYTADQHNGTAYSEDFEVEGVIPSTQTWGTDSYTIYTVKVGPKPIEFDVESIVDWTNKPTLDPTTIQ